MICSCAAAVVVDCSSSCFGGEDGVLCGRYDAGNALN